MSNANKKQSATFTTLANGDKAVNALVIEGDIAKCTLTSKPENDSPIRYVQHWNFDFSDCSREELIKLATSTVKINLQSSWRKDQHYSDAEKWDNITINVKKDMIDAQKVRSTANPTQKILTVAKTMSEEDKAALIKLLQSK